MFLDYDGTLTPIRDRPEQAVLGESMREVVRRLSERCVVAIITGRGLADVRALVGLPRLYYAGSHGFEIAGPDVTFTPEPALRATFERILPRAVALASRFEGAMAQSKGFSISIHYRLSAASSVPAIEAAVDRLLLDEPALRKDTGKKVFELRPSVDWHKGSALRWLREHLEAETRRTHPPIFIGDDRTDEDALAVVRDDGVGIFVGRPRWPSAAHFSLPDPASVERLLLHLAEREPPSRPGEDPGEDPGARSSGGG